MAHILITLSDKQRTMYIAPRGKRPLQKFMTMADTHGWAWRLHDGSGWADESPEAWRYIQDITTECMARVVY